MLKPELEIIHKKRVTVDNWNSAIFAKQGVEVRVLRLDKIHPIISGSKWFKLKNYLAEAKEKKYPGILTFGGAYSNHILAAAYAAMKAGLRSTGIIRGEKSQSPSRTIQTAEQYGMLIEYVSREEYKRRNEPDFIESISKKYPGLLVVPEGGAGELGIQASEEIAQWIEKSRHTHIICAVGTGTQFLGLANACAGPGEIMGICVLKGMPDLLNSYSKWMRLPENMKFCSVNYNYHFGGYARKTPALITFMNQHYLETGIPSDFVYTGKLFYAVAELVRQGHFSLGSKILIIHSGGLQGNLSLPKGTLIY